ncbi:MULTISPECIES: T9SS type A sorting domain-containing protein [Flavobacterium]|uniref:T9SS type A sorting domain-containing protein n=1 Tax=Flavobacterium jumunjinense TaxID=998845 RepID=A0ABV5GTQ5_9FLAO|nr:MULTISPECIES: T9SS type A sorting domain-containing protein [Flavobacterium]
MKNLFYLVLISLTINYANSQCLINGPSEIIVGQTQTYSIPANAQCSNCYDWDTITSNIEIVGSDQNSSVSILALGSGSFDLQLTYFDENGCHTCVLKGTCNPNTTCCAPILTGFYECRPAGNGGGTVRFETSSTCEIDWSNVSNIYIELNGATFNTAPLSGQYFGTLNGPFNNPFHLSFTGPNCTGGSSVGIYAKISYKNDCPPVEIFENFFDQGSPKQLNKKNTFNEDKIKIFPNPTKSLINFEGEELSNFIINIYDNNGVQIIKNQTIDKPLNIEKNIPGIYSYIITNGSNYKQEGKIIKE